MDTKFKLRENDARSAGTSRDSAGANILKRLGQHLIILFLCAFGLPGALAQELPGWKLVWADEFDQPDGSSPDASKWVFDIGTGNNGWGNNELQYYTSRTNNARIEGGHLVIEARQESFGGRNYTSARLKTQGKASWTYGRMEARINLSRGKGIWPAFWMLGTNFTSVGWPACGEIDIMENIGSETNRVHGTIHGPGYSGANGIGGSLSLPGGAAYADDFHVFAAEWETNRIRWFMDGQLFFSVTPARLPAGSQWVFTQPQFILLNLAVGGNWPGAPDASTVFPQRLTVDYVRVYAATNTSEPESPPGCDGNALVNPGFEVGGLTGWQTYGNGFNTVIQHVSSAPVRGGTNVFKVFGQFTGGDNYSGVYQDLPTSPGTSYTAHAWAYTPANDRIAGANAAWIEVTFRDVGLNILSFYRSGIFNADTPAEAWHNLAVTNRISPVTYQVIGSVTNLPAPAGAEWVRYQVVFRQPSTAAGAVLFDDLNLSLPVDPEVPIPALVARDDDQLRISFPTTDGLAYQVRYREELNLGQWLVLTNLTGDGTTRTVADALSSDRRFYHVVRVCN